MDVRKPLRRGPPDHYKTTIVVNAEPCPTDCWFHPEYEKGKVMKTREIVVQRGVKQVFAAFRSVGLTVVDRGWNGHLTVQGTPEQFAAAWKRCGGGPSHRPWETITELHGNVREEDDDECLS